MTKVKICGITRADDAAFAEELGADYLGFIFVRESPRYIEPERVPRTSRAKRVGVFRNAPAEEVRRIAAIARLDLVQLHGEETYALDLPTIKAFQVRDALPETETHAQYVLFDSGGGTGRTFDWTLLAGYARSKPFFLAGGITPGNVAAAIAAARPYAIDVASGVESRPGVKDFVRLKRLFEAIRQ